MAHQLTSEELRGIEKHLDAARAQARERTEQLDADEAALNKQQLALDDELKRTLSGGAR